MANNVTCRQYGTEAGDYQTVAGWFASHRGGEIFPEMVLPPHGVIASVDGMPAAALWVYLSYGIGVAHVHWAVGRPGLGFGVLGRAFKAAMSWIEDVCRSHDCHLIFTCARRPVAMYLARGGFNSFDRDHVFLTKVI